MGRIGADEAGKGPVLGSMFAAAVRVADGATLPDGVRDSKALTPERREDLALEIQGTDGITVGIAEVPPSRIDEPETDMNSLTVWAQASAIGEIATPDDDCVLDASDVRPDRFGGRVGNRLDVETEIHAAHRADEAHPIVAAASIVAKVNRDAHVADLAEEYGSIGSGYPSDPQTRSFLEEFVHEESRLPDCARRSWQTCADVIAAAEQAGLADF